MTTLRVSGGSRAIRLGGAAVGAEAVGAEARSSFPYPPERVRYMGATSLLDGSGVLQGASSVPTIFQPSSGYPGADTIYVGSKQPFVGLRVSISQPYQLAESYANTSASSFIVAPHTSILDPQTAGNVRLWYGAYSGLQGPVLDTRLFATQQVSAIWVLQGFQPGQAAYGQSVVIPAVASGSVGYASADPKWLPGWFPNAPAPLAPDDPLFYWARLDLQMYWLLNLTPATSPLLTRITVLYY